MRILAQWLCRGRARRRRAGAALLAVGLLGGWVGPVPAQDILPAGEAFRLEARMASPDTLAVTWRVAEDYYMYRQRFSVEAVDGDVTLGEPVFPEGRRKQDEFFGEMEVYESDVTFTVPVSGAGDFTLEAAGQGCNEPVGICYPPIKQTVTVPAAGASPAPSSTQGGQSTAPGEAGTLQSLLGTGSSQAGFLPPEQAFRFETTAMDARTLLVRFFIEPGYYLYKDKLDIQSTTPAVAVARVSLPPGQLQNDEYFGESFVFYDAVDAEVSLERGADEAGRVELAIGYQGCAEDGICYPPVDRSVSVAMPGAGSTPPAAGTSQGGAGFFSDGVWPVLLAFGAGLLLTFTPCVLPMIPILGGVVVGQGATVTRARGGALAAVYVLGTAVTYTAVGVLAGLTGDQLQAYFQNIWAIGLVAALLTLMALAMFGLFEVAVPAGLQTRLQQRAVGIRTGAFGGVFLLGMVSALIVGACVSPVLISVLGLAISRGDPWLGGAIMFAMALGMGVFLVALGMGFGHLLPRSGAWMNRVKHGFGIMLLAVAVYLLGAIPEVPVMYLWAALLAGTALYAGARAGVNESLGRRLARQTAILLLGGWAVLAVIGGLQGGRDIFQPVDAGKLAGAERASVHARFQRVAGPEELAGRMQTARAEGAPVMVDYYADWCVDCVRMEETTFADPAVAEILNERFVLLQVDVTDPAAPGPRAIKQAHGIYGPPAMLFFDEEGDEVSGMRRYGYMDSTAFLDHIEPLR